MGCCMTRPVPIFVISLASATLRRTRIRAHLDALGLKYDIVDATDGRLLTEDERRHLAPDATAMSPGAIGCYASHLEAYRRIVDRALPLGLILEDDARLNPAVVPLLKAGFTAAPLDRR